MDIKKPLKARYTEESWNKTMHDIGIVLNDNALCTDDILQRPDVMQFIDKYCTSEVLDEKKESGRTLLGISWRLCNMEVNSSSGNKIIPVINEYEGHNLMKMYFFKLDENNRPRVAEIEVTKKSLLY